MVKVRVNLARRHHGAYFDALGIRRASDADFVPPPGERTPEQRGTAVRQGDVRGRRNVLGEQVRTLVRVRVRVRIG